MRLICWVGAAISWVLSTSFGWAVFLVGLWWMYGVMAWVGGVWLPMPGLPMVLIVWGLIALGRRLFWAGRRELNG